MDPIRRKVLGFLAAAPLAGPLAARAAAEKGAAQLAGVTMLPAGQSGNAPLPSPMATSSQMRALLLDPRSRAELMSAIYEDEFRVYSLDHDLASNRSFSLAAKIAYQRDRNVERRLANMHNEWPWQRINAAVTRYLGFPMSSR